MRSAAASSMPSSARAGWTAAFMRRCLKPRQQEAATAVGEQGALARDLLDDRALGDVVPLDVAPAVDEDRALRRLVRVDVEVDGQLRQAGRGRDGGGVLGGDRKSTRLNSSHLGISYAVFC